MTEFDKIIADKLAQADYPVDHQMWSAIESSIGNTPKASVPNASFMPAFIGGIAATAAMVMVLSLMPNQGPIHSTDKADSGYQGHVSPQNNHRTAPYDNEPLVHTPQESHEIELTAALPSAQKVDRARLPEAEDERAGLTQEVHKNSAAVEPLEKSASLEEQISFNAVGIQCVGSSVNFKAEGIELSDSKWIIDGVHVLEGREIDYTFDEAGKHQVVLISSVKGKSTSTERSIQIYEQPIGSVAYEVEAHAECFGQTVKLKAEPGTNTYAWSVHQQTLHGSSAALLLERGTYSTDVHIVNEHGCTNDQNILVNVEGGLELFIPNSFSPNNDGNNDVWLPVGLDKGSEHHLQIFRAQDNALVFETTEGEAWDGRMANSSDRAQRGEQFIYRIILKDECGAEKELKGSITLMP
ncbi:MAG: gliding motility-associated C-terminal domain-containing protein [Cryomorphaceae bacterium]